MWSAVLVAAFYHILLVTCDMSKCILMRLRRESLLCTSEALDATEAGVIVLCCCVLLVLSCLDFHCLALPEAFDASEAGIIVLYCRVSFLLSCLVVHSLARPKHSMHLRRGSLRLREM